MGGWQRLGVVISALWVIGAPIYEIIEDHRRLDLHWWACVAVAEMASISKDDPSRADLRDCEQAREIDHKKLAEAYWNPVWWSVILLPVALFWLVGGILFGTARWVRRGFARRSNLI
jgi:hypothetical protein